MLSETTSIGYRFHISTQRCLAVLTAKGKYALKALIYLSTLEPGEKAQGVAISKAGNIPKKFLDAILGELRNAGVVFTKKGPGGGYMLARAASDIKIGQVVRAIDGPLAPIACASRSAYEPCSDCKSVKACAVRFTMVKVRDAVSEILDQMTVADMVAISEGRNVTHMVSGHRSVASSRKRR